MDHMRARLLVIGLHRATNAQRIGACIADATHRPDLRKRFGRQIKCELMTVVIDQERRRRGSRQDSDPTVIRRGIELPADVHMIVPAVATCQGGAPVNPDDAVRRPVTKGCQDPSAPVRIERKTTSDFSKARRDRRVTPTGTSDAVQITVAVRAIRLTGWDRGTAGGSLAGGTVRFGREDSGYWTATDSVLCRAPRSGLEC